MPGAGFEKHPGGPVQLADDDALGAVDDEGAVLGHERDVAEIDLLLLDVAHALPFGLVVLVPNHEPHGHLEGNREGHAPFLALLDRILDVQLHRAAAEFAARVLDLVPRPAVPAGARVRVVGAVDDGLAALAAICSEVIQALQVTALALPVADGVFDEFQGGGAAKIVDRKNGVEHRLQPDILPFRGRDVHLQEPMVRFSLDFDQIRNGDAGVDLAEVHPVPIHIRSADIGH